MSIKVGENQISEMIIHRKENRGHYTFLSNKVEDDKWDTYPINVGFKKGVELEDGTKIKVTDGFITFYRKEPVEGEERGQGVVKLMVLDYEIVERKETNESLMSEITDDDLPF